jgi:AcrR family transcriptional regulator
MPARPAAQGRPYDNTGRVERARLTRQRVLEAARKLLLTNGYPATTIKAVATAADVSAEFVYKTFGNKATLVKHVYDATMAADDHLIDETSATGVGAVIAATSIQEKVRRYADMVRRLQERIGPLLGVLLPPARAGEADLAVFAATIEQERLGGVGQFVAHLADTTDRLRDDIDRAHAVDIVWTLISPELYQLFVVVRGWTSAEYGTWLASALSHELIADTPGDATAAPALPR